MDELQVTIGIPVCQVEKYVRKSLLSALAQDFPYPFEILVVDDRGTDRSMDIVSEVAAQHPSGDRVRIVQHDRNLGLGEARNTIIRNAKGKYLYFLDSDDWIYPNALSVLYAKAEDTQAEITCASSVSEEEKTGEQTIYCQYKDDTYEHEAVGVWMCLQNIKMALMVWNNLYRMDFLRKNDIHAIHHVYEDHWFTHSAWLYAKKMSMVSTVTLCYNIREGSIMTSMLGKKATDEAAEELCDDIVQIWELIENKFRQVEGVYDFYYSAIMDVLICIVASYYTEEQVRYIKQSLRNMARKVPSVRSLQSTRNRFIYLCSCLYDNGYSFYHYDALYTKLQRYFGVSVLK